MAQSGEVLDSLADTVLVINLNGQEETAKRIDVDCDHGHLARSENVDENWLDEGTQNCYPVDPTLDHLPSRCVQQAGIRDHRAQQDSVIVLHGQFSKCLDNRREAWVRELCDETEQATAA